MTLVVPFEEIFKDRRDLLASHESWDRLDLGTVCKILNGFPFESSLFNKAEGFPVIRIRDLSRGTTDTLYNGEFPEEYVVENGDLLISMDGLFGCFEWNGGSSGLNQRVCKIIPNESVLDRKFLLFGINGYLKAIQDATSSVTVGHLSSRDVLRIPFPLPSRNEQRRIVAELEGLLCKLEACQKRLAKIPVILKRFRQSVLAAACSGRLTAHWREKNADVEPAGTLIQAERHRIAMRSEDLPPLPQNWEWTALGNYGRCSRGRFSVRPRNDPSCFGGNHPFIQIGDLPPDGGLIKRHNQTLNEKGLGVSKKSSRGTVVVAIVGATIGNTGILAYDMCFPDSLVGIETGTETGNRFVELYMRSRKESLRQTSYASGGQPNINLETLNSYPFALPPFREQQEIVRRVDDLFEVTDQTQDSYLKAQTQVDRLKQSILAKAFRGELVPTDAELASREGREFEPS